ncbi:MAG TPA: D-glycero-beta-D-manno-heptose 1,7-bisphosphate 7-phosphatase [Acidiferrobacteraceae bacterium]|nr:D-glycero-beta-D-manno-heptose 1,7-bisphosphate 7-phosphatase [Acidiferrobacteraceae bacterium]
MRLVILDRDGVINEDSDDFIKSPEEWIPIPGSLEAITRLCREDYRVVLATNQSGVARGLFDMDTLNQIHLRMLDQIRQKGGEIDAIFFCPHGPDDGCDCRKPKAGMFRDIADRLHINITGVPVVGDSLRDIQAAQVVDALPILVLTGKGKKTLDNMGKDEIKGMAVFEDLYAFSEALIAGQLDGRISDVITLSDSYPVD